MNWNLFSEKKPSKNGWYLCTVEVKNQQRYVMDLYWYNEKQTFEDNRVKHVFEVYTVLDYTGGRLTKNEVCDRTKGVVFWAELPAPNMDGFERKIDFEPIK